MAGWESYLIYGIGFLSQGLFAARLIIQWILSEKEGRVVSPVIFWQLSVVASYLFMIYGVLQNDFVIIFGQALGYIIYIRNLQLEGAWKSIAFPFRAGAILVPMLTLIWFFLPFGLAHMPFDSAVFFRAAVIAGATGQTLLNLRFVYQWYYAERFKTSFFPVGFWYMTTTGSLLVIIYAVQHFDPVLLLAQGVGLIASLRNIQLYFKTKEAR